MLMGAGSIICSSMIQHSPLVVYIVQTLTTGAGKFSKSAAHEQPQCTSTSPACSNLPFFFQASSPPSTISLSPSLARNNLSAEVYALSAATFHGRGSPAA